MNPPPPVQANRHENDGKLGLFPFDDLGNTQAAGRHDHVHRHAHGHVHAPTYDHGLAAFTTSLRTTLINEKKPCLSSARVGP